ncbi:MAG: hypothetical protein M3388_00895 [Acidobacteriota bacterium]|nr:hypothetical protein [Acidobacteriota bacterium]
MIEKNPVTQEGFDTLLNWLDRNRETAGEKYEKIRRRLIRIFVGRGCYEAEELADETISRVTLKLPQVIENYLGDPILYFYGVANHIHHEWLRKQNKTKNLQLLDTDKVSAGDSESEYECLETCLETLPANQRQLIIEYYRNEKTAKIEHRRKLAKELEISPNALQVKTFRIRTNLQECVRNCIAEKNL